MSLERARPFWTHMSTYKLRKTFEMANFGTDGATKGGTGGMRVEG